MIYDRLACAYGNFRTRRQRRRFLKMWLESENFMRTGLTADEISSRFEEECRSPADFQRLLMESMAEKQGATRWADSTPMNILFMREIKRAFPDAIFIHVVRDGRDVALSLSREKWIRPLFWSREDWITPAALFWEWVVEIGRRDGRALGKDYLEIHYEELVRDPQSCLDKVGSVIGHTFDYDRILTLGIGSVGRPNSAFRDTDGRQSKFRPLQRWKSLFDDEGLVKVEKQIGKGLMMYGYELRFPHLQRSSWERIERRCYRANFMGRNFLKTRTFLGSLSSPAIRRALDEKAIEDKTLRPAQNIEYIRKIVRGEAS